MSLERDPAEPPFGVSPYTISEPVGPRRRRPSTAGWLSLALGFVILGALAIVPTPYVIEQPGPVFDVLGQVRNSDDKKVPLISIDGADTYDTGGTLDMLTVSVVGNPEQRPNWLTVIQAWFDPSRAVVPLESIYPTGVTQEQRDSENQTLMVNSQQDAVAAALNQLDYDFTQQVVVGEVVKDTPSEGKLDIGDTIISANGTEIRDVAQLRGVIADNGVDKALSLVIDRNGTETTVEITPVTATYSDGSKAAVVGIATTMNYEFPFDVTIQLDNVGGPSAGMMFALGIIDKLTPGKLNGGKNVAGTGTIDSAGTVGPIGGIRQKLFGARDAGAKYFLAPDSNCNEVVGHVPDGIRVFSVKTLDDSMKALKTISDGGDLDSLPTCEK